MRYLRFFSAVVALLIFSVAAAEEKAAPDPEPEDLSEAVNKLEELFQLKGKSINKRFPQLLWRGTEQKTLYCPGAETKKFRYGEENVYASTVTETVSLASGLSTDSTVNSTVPAPSPK